MLGKRGESNGGRRRVVQDMISKGCGSKKVVYRSVILNGRRLKVWAVGVQEEDGGSCRRASPVVFSPSFIVPSCVRACGSFEFCLSVFLCFLPYCMSAHFPWLRTQIHLVDLALVARWDLFGGLNSQG